MNLRAGLRALTGLLLGVLLVGCVTMPTSGPVMEVDGGTRAAQDRFVYSDPRPPQAGQSPAEIVNGFLEAMTATPIQANAARKFLTAAAGATWNPELETITYVDALAPQGTAQVTVQLTGADRLDERGAWQGELPKQEQRLSFPMVLEDGEYRIAAAPDALIVPEIWFDQRFRQVPLYFFDPTASILVPEPVFVPRGEQLATSLVRGLLRGPGERAVRSTRSFLPSGLALELSVPVSARGVADIVLTGDPGQQSPATVELMLAQLAWTLRQDPAITALRLTIEGEQVRLPGGVDEFSVDDGSPYDPSGDQASTLLYGIQDGLLVSGQLEALAPVDGPLGRAEMGVRSIGVNLGADTVAAVDASRSSVLLAPVYGAEKDGAQVQEILSGATDLLAPAWDFRDRLWLVDRAPGGARVLWWQAGRSEVLEVPGLSGRNVRSFLISRDSTRLIAVVRQRRRDSIVVSRIVHDDQGRIVGATRARPVVRADEAELRIRDIAWSGPASVAALHRINAELTQVRTISVDGAPSAGSTTTTLDGAGSLVGTPRESSAVYAVLGDQVVDLSQSSRPRTQLPAGLTALTYVG